jgi:lipopolysaccharide biosynthesis glycosyltransferase
MRPFQIYIGYDKAEPVAYHTCVESILDNSSIPVSITPLYQPTLKEFVLPKHLDGYKPSNGFIFTRFLVPYLSNYRGVSLFLDGDMVVTGDIAELADEPMGYYGVKVVKHDYKTTANQKYLGAVNLDYPRKNWSSVILFNCGFYPNNYLTPETVGAASGEYLHQFKWLKDKQIGELPKGWNVLADEPNQATDPKLIHYTLGTPCFNEYKNCQYAETWHEYRQAVNSCYQKG